MATRRMFDAAIIGGDDFTEMNPSAQVLYFQLMGNADDDGIIGNPKGIMRLAGCAESDLTELASSGFIIRFAKVAAITHWHVHNKIRKDAYRPTMFKAERELLTIDDSGVYVLKTEPVQDCDRSCTEPVQDCDETCTKPVQDCNESVTEPVEDSLHSIGKVRLGKVRLGKVRLGSEGGSEEGSTTTTTTTAVKYSEIEKAWNTAADKNGMTKVKKASEWSTQRKNRLKSLVTKHGFDDVIATIEKAGDSDFLGGQNKRGWRCGIDWFSNAQNYVKIAEGNYTDEQQKVSDRFSGENDITAYL